MIKISVIILNFNGQRWLEKCFESLRRQTIWSEIEVVLADNKSSDGSDHFAEKWFVSAGRGRVVQNGANLGYCEGNNRGAAVATGRYFLFLNSDTWLEPDCLSKLYDRAEAAQADIAVPLVMEYMDDSYQGTGGSGFDLFGFACWLPQPAQDQELFAGYGAALCVRGDTFRRVGGFDGAMFMYADETDLSWRVWIAGGKVVTALAARLHHWGSPEANPEGGAVRTTETKRSLANRNGILLLAKNCQHVLLLLLLSHILFLILEGLVMLMIVRRWSYLKRCYWDAVVGCWKMRAGVWAWRRRIRGMRKRSDFWMLRFFRLVPSRWYDFQRMRGFGQNVPKVEAR